MIYRNLAIAAVVGAAAACASTGSSTTDGTTTTATADSAGVTATTGLQATTTDSVATTVDSASARSTTSMSAGGDMAGAAQLDTVIAVLDRGLTTVPQAEAVAAISSLQSYLSGATDPALSGMATEFDALKAELQKPTVDNKAVGAVLSRIGPKATAAAQSAGPNSDRVSRLGTALTSAGSKLSGGM